MPLIHELVKNYDYVMLKSIIDDHLINVNVRSCGRTPLHISRHNHSAECIRVLLSQKDINVNA